MMKEKQIPKNTRGLVYSHANYRKISGTSAYFRQDFDIRNSAP